VTVTTITVLAREVLVVQRMWNGTLQTQKPKIDGEDVVQNETDGSATVVIMTLGIAGVTSVTRHPRHPTNATADASDTAGATVVCLPSSPSTRCVVHYLETKSSKSLGSLESLGPSGSISDHEWKISRGLGGRQLPVLKTTLVAFHGITRSHEPRFRFKSLQRSELKSGIGFFRIDSSCLTCARSFQHFRRTPYGTPQACSNQFLCLLCL